MMITNQELHELQMPQIIIEDEKYNCYSFDSEEENTHQEAKIVSYDDLIKFIKENHGEDAVEEWTKEGNILYR